jgi:tRNA(fMet)-specific endonuclease VapC
MSRLAMLDTNMASALIKNLSAPLRARLAATPVALACVSAVTEGELRFRLAKMPQTKHAEAARRFLATIPILPWDSAAAEAYGTLRAQLERAGTPLGALDTLIAAHALALDAELVTADKAFSQAPGLRVSDWTA